MSDSKKSWSGFPACQVWSGFRASLVWSGFPACLVFVLLAAGCSSGRPTVFLHPNFNFAFIERVAVVPFENLGQEQGAAARVSRLFVSDLLATKAFDVIEPGEVSLALEKYGKIRTAELSREQIIDLGQSLGVQGLIFGSVESSGSTGMSGPGNVCALVVRMVETDEGSTVWSASASATGRGFWSRTLGSGQASGSEVASRCVDRAIRTLVR